MDINEFQRALIRVDAPGMYTTIQDLGRIGFQQYGMCLINTNRKYEYKY